MSWYSWMSPGRKKSESYKDWLERMMASGMIKADPTPGNVLATKALPWGMRNVYEPVTHAMWRPVTMGQKYGWQAGAASALGTAANPMGALFGVGVPTKSPLQAQKFNRKLWEEYKAPHGHLPGGFQVGVKGAMELANPLNLATLEMGGGATTAGLRKGAQIAAQRGATRVAGGLGKAALGTAKAQRVVGAIENLPGKAVTAPIGLARRGIQKTVPSRRFAALEARKVITPLEKRAALKTVKLTPPDLTPARPPQTVPESFAERQAKVSQWRRQTRTGTVTSPEGYNIEAKWKGTETGKTVPEPKKPVTQAIPETPAMAPKPIEPIRPLPGGQGGVPQRTVPIGQGFGGQTLPMSEQSLGWLKTQVTASRAASGEVKKFVERQTAKVGAAIREARSLGGEEGYQSLSAKPSASVIELPPNQTVRANVDFVQKQIDDFYALKEELTGKQLDYDWKHASDALHKFARNERAMEHEVEALLEAVPEIVASPKPQTLTAAQTMKELAKIGWAIPSDVSKAMMTMLDHSSVLLQGRILGASHPTAGVAGAAKGAKAAFRPKYFEKLQLAIEKNPLKPVWDYFNVDFTDIVGPKMEEAYGVRVMRAIPGVKQVWEGSGRAFVTDLNTLRAHVATDMYSKWVQQYPDIAEAIAKGTDVPTGPITDKALKQGEAISWLTNVAGGRGGLGPFKKWAPFLRDVFFTPQLYSARLQYIPMGAAKAFQDFTENGFKNSIVMKEYARELVALAGTTAAILEIAHLSGAKVELDLRSTDWGKIRVGDTRIDVMGGFQPYLRYTNQIIRGQRKSTTGRIYEADRMDSFGRFLRSKEAPFVGFLHDMATGSTFIGEDVTVGAGSAKKYAYEKFTPLFIQDIVEAVRQEGAEGAAVIPPAFFGAMTQSYGPESDSVQDYRDKVAKDAYGMSWDDVGTQKGVLYQQELVDSTPKLKKIVDKQNEQKLKAAGVPKTAWDRWYGAQNQITQSTNQSLKVASDAMLNGTISPKDFRLRVDEIMGNARQARDWLETDPQYRTVVKFLAEPAGKSMAINDIAYNDYINQVFAANMSDALGRYNYEDAELAKQAIAGKYGPEVYQYIQQRLARGHKDDPQALMMLRQARETLKPYWGIEDRMWAMRPQLKAVNDQIEMLESTNPRKAELLKRRWPSIVSIRKRIAQQKKLMRLRNPAIEQALVFYR